MAHEPDPSDLKAFYEEGYSHTGEEARRSEAWRALGARAKADHVLALAPCGLPADARVLDVGCGDGALLEELRDRRPGWRLAGVELSEQAAAIARDRVPEADVRPYDGERLPAGDDEFDLGILSHVLEHVVDPAAVLREAARACRLVVAEVPLERNVSTRRGSKRRIARSLGHLHRLDRAAVQRIAQDAGLRVLGAVADPLPRDVHRFFADTPRARRLADAKWAARATLHRLAPPVAERAFTVHYAVLCGR